MQKDELIWAIFVWVLDRKRFHCKKKAPVPVGTWRFLVADSGFEPL